ncbi:MAG TPA: PAS domain-containing sensor histidine kinase [Anaerolineae bacterium]|nr:PAS domain-containing sensor histidine kinase [Anaerolineae bacterium]
MDDAHKTTVELIDELQQLRQRVANLEAVTNEYSDAGSLVDVLTKYRLLAAVAQDVILFVRARDGRILEANRAAEETYGYSRAELLNLTIYDLRASSTRSLVVSQMNQSDLQGITFETLHQRRDGREFPVEVNSGGVTVDGERILLSIVRDITDRKQADRQREVMHEALRQSEERFSLTFAHAPAALSLARVADGRIFEVNDRFLELFGYTRADVIGYTSLELNMYVDPAERAALLDRMRTHGVIRDHEMTVRTHSGETRQVLVSTVLVQINLEAYMLTTLIDITARQRAEEALRQSEELFSKSFFIGPVALCLTRTVDGRFFEVNDRFVALLEYSREELIGHTTLELEMYPDPAERAMLVAQLRTQGFVREYELTLRTHSGMLRRVLLSSVAVQLNNEDCILATLIDLTERKQMETALQELNTTLEERVQSRTAELQIATNRLQELDRLKDEFVARISHELRTPLAIVQLHLALLATGKPEKRQQYLDILRRETQRLRVLIEDLLKINQLTSDVIEIEPHAADLNQLIETHLYAWSELAAQHYLEFETDLAADVPSAWIDPELIAQVIAQLLHNAINYTAQGTIKLFTSQRQQNGRVWATVSVADTGPGIAPDELPHIFERFYRGRAAADYKTPGVGVGLSISRDIISLLGGHITVESKVMRGSTFTLWLPLAPAD